MKIKINRNILWTEAFSKELSEIGVKYACISPGSRNTPLTLAFANNKKIKSYVHIDERSCAFFALGMAKASGTPVVIVCTSGTAAAELYPAIIEAYQQRVPLIVCTADRPPELLDCGANQTINQDNLYKNHIRWFFDVGLPEPITRRIKHIKAVAGRAVFESCIRSRGPVHLNFPFRKPFEPESYTDEISDDLKKLADTVLTDKQEFFKQEEKNILTEKWFPEIFSHIKKKRKGLIIAGPENYNPLFAEACQKLSVKLGYPVMADGASQLRFGGHDKQNIISNFEGFLRSKHFADKYKPDIILHFGRTITSKALDEYLEKCNAVRFMINEYGDWFDPSNKAAASFPCRAYLFCQKMLEMAESRKLPPPDSKWVNKFVKADEIARSIKRKIIHKAKFPAESRIVEEIMSIIPGNTHLMISNSMPVRDFDYFASKTSTKVTIYNNRGASGIDGITSTALGIAAVNNQPTVLITGDLAFYYDLNGLLAASKYALPLVVVLINNNGGGIFEVLPVSDYGKIFKDYFIAPHNLDFSQFVKAYNGAYYAVKSWEHFRKSFKSAIDRKKFAVIEIKTDAVKSLALRKKFWASVDEYLGQHNPL
jgi:2-succinyl-5-enolpyruvyl-6-hydroxy-3-cyclohexene-1-carboxylate synthase